MHWVFVCWASPCPDRTLQLPRHLERGVSDHQISLSDIVEPVEGDAALHALPDLVDVLL